MVLDIPQQSTQWELLERIATHTKSRLVFRDQKIAFVKGPAKSSASLDGAFRIAPKSVIARMDAITGETDYTLAVDVQWEPRFPVFRIDAQPRLAQLLDDRGSKLEFKPASIKSAVSGYGYTSEIRVQGLDRQSRSIASFIGEFTVTASPRMLAFEFADLTKLPATTTIDGVKATLSKIVKRESVWELQFTVEYPNEPPVFESFESWTDRNTVRLIAAEGRQISEPDNQDLIMARKSFRAAYRYAFKVANLTNTVGWKVIYTAPAPLVEFPVKFQLKDIPLP